MAPIVEGGTEALETLPRGCFCPEKHLVVGSKWTLTLDRTRLKSQLHHLPDGQPWVKHFLS